MNRFIFFMSCLWCCLNWGCIREGTPSAYTETLEVGDRLPVFSVDLNDGKVFDNVELEGKVGVLVFFRTLCPDCQKELPVIQQLYDYYKNDSRVCICCINWREDAGTVERFWQTEELTIPYAVECREAVYESFACNVVPTVLVCNQRQVICYKYGDNPVASFEELSQAVEACLKEN